MSNAFESISAWIHRAVIGHNLCPFAQGVVKSGRLSLCCHRAIGVEDAMERVMLEAVALGNLEDRATVIVVFEDGLEDFQTFLEVVYGCEELLTQMSLDKVVQLAHFHPEYRFADSPEGSAENFSNRSPLPAIHLLLVDEVAEAVRSHPDTLQIARRNVDYLSGLTHSELIELQFGSEEEQSG